MLVMPTTWPSPDSISFGNSASRHPHLPHHVRLVHRQPLLLVGLGDRVEAERAAGVVDEDVAGADCGYEGLDRGRVGDVERDRLAADLCRQLLEPLEAAGAENRAVALAGQRPRGRCADAAGSAGDHRGLHRFRP